MEPSESEKNSAVEFKLSALADEFIPKQFVADDACLYLEQTLDYLHADPEELDAILNDLHSQFMTYVDDSILLEMLTDTLINKCIQTDNFQYMGAKCSVYLCSQVVNANNEKTFQGLFFRKCNNMFKEYLNCDHVKPYQLNFTLFIAELTVFLKTPDGKNFGVLIRSTIDLLATLLELVADDSYKCLQQVIKMSGFKLQDVEPDRYEKLLQSMRLRLESDKLNQKQKDILSGIISRVRSPTNINVGDHGNNVACGGDDGVGEISARLNNGILDSRDDGVGGNDNGTLSASGEPCTYDICHDVTIFSQDAQQYVVANEDAEPEIFEDYELFVSENEPQMDAYAEEEYDNYLKHLGDN